MECPARDLDSHISDSLSIPPSVFVVLPPATRVRHGICNVELHLVAGGKADRTRVTRVDAGRFRIRSSCLSPAVYSESRTFARHGHLGWGHRGVRVLPGVRPRGVPGWPDSRTAQWRCIVRWRWREALRAASLRGRCDRGSEGGYSPIPCATGPVDRPGDIHTAGPRDS